MPTLHLGFTSLFLDLPSLKVFVSKLCSRPFDCILTLQSIPNNHSKPAMTSAFNPYFLAVICRNSIRILHHHELNVFLSQHDHGRMPCSSSIGHTLVPTRDEGSDVVKVRHARALTISSRFRCRGSIRSSTEETIAKTAIWRTTDRKSRRNNDKVTSPSIVLVERQRDKGLRSEGVPFEDVDLEDVLPVLRLFGQEPRLTDEHVHDHFGTLPRGR